MFASLRVLKKQVKLLEAKSDGCDCPTKVVDPYFEEVCEVPNLAEADADELSQHPKVISTESELECSASFCSDDFKVADDICSAGIGAMVRQDQLQVLEAEMLVDSQSHEQLEAEPMSKKSRVSLAVDSSTFIAEEMQETQYEKFMRIPLDSWFQSMPQETQLFLSITSFDYSGHCLHPDGYSLRDACREVWPDFIERRQHVLQTLSLKIGRDYAESVLIMLDGIHSNIVRITQSQDADL